MKYLPIFIWMVLIFIFSHQPKDESEEYSRLAIWLLQTLGIDLTEIAKGNATFVVRKAAHMTEYFILCTLALNITKTKWTTPNFYYIAIIFSILYACSDEFHQTFIQGRVGCIQDVGVDSIGVLIAAAIFWLTRKYFFTPAINPN